MDFLSINIKQTVCTYLCMALPTLPPDQGVPQAPKPKQITGKNLYLTKNASNFSQAALGHGWVVYIYI